MAFLRKARRRDRADDSVTVAQRHQVVRDAARHDQAVLDRLVAVAIAQRDLVATHRRHEDDAVRHRRAVGHAVGAIGAKYTRRISLVFAHRPRMIEQRAETPDADRQVGSQQVFAVVVEEHPPDRRFQKRRAARVAGRVPGVRVILSEPHHRRSQRRHHRIDVAADGRLDAPTDECRGVLERPDELIDHLHHFDGDVGGLPSFGHEEDRDLVVARAQELQEGMRTLVIVVFSQRPVDQHRVDRGVRGDHRSSVFGGRRLDHLDTAALQLLHERPYRAPFGGRIAELVIDDERT